MLVVGDVYLAVSYGDSALHWVFSVWSFISCAAAVVVPKVSSSLQVIAVDGAVVGCRVEFAVG